MRKMKELIVCLFIFTLCSSCSSKSITKENILPALVFEHMKTIHYLPLKVDDSFSEKMFDLYIKRLDYGKRYFYQKDIDEMKKYRTRVDDEFKKGASRFFHLSYTTIEKRQRETEKIFEEILSKPFDFTKKENLESDPDKIGYVTTEKELKERWRKYLKFSTLKKLVEYVERRDNNSDSGAVDTLYKNKTDKELEIEARKKVLKDNRNIFKRFTQNTMDDWLAIYINSFTSVYGPHTNYFPPKEKEDFDISMSGQLEGIGAQLQMRDGYIRVFSIVPGSASARQGELQAKDIILEVAQGDDEPVNVVDMRLDEAVSLIRGKKGTEVRLTVKKVDGSVKVIPIIRDVVILEATYAKSLILDDKNDKDRVGYIHLPKFYADFTNSGGRSCAEDVKKEIAKLKKENVDGIILDLRNNGGGSLEDVVDMTGLFIKDGPIVQVRSRSEKTTVLKDRDSDIDYSGKLIVLINSSSASASEILAAAIQDYKRGVIVGVGKSSFGKGTVQRFFSIDRMVSPVFNNIKPLGALKVTTQKFYRVTGGATQLKGVIPDIVLPDIYMDIETGEKDQEFVMKWDEIQKARFQQWNQNINIPELQKRSSVRVAQDTIFTKITEYAQKLKKLNDDTKISLNFASYKKEREERKKESEFFNNLAREYEELDIKNISTDLTSINKDSTRVEQNKKWKKELKKDYYLHEALAIMKNMK